MKVLIIWVSRHRMTKKQIEALSQIHGNDFEVAWTHLRFTHEEHIADFIKSYQKSGQKVFVYAVAPIVQLVIAGFQQLEFGYFQRDGRRNNMSSQNGSTKFLAPTFDEDSEDEVEADKADAFEFNAVYHFGPSGWKKVWPLSGINQEGGE